MNRVPERTPLNIVPFIDIMLVLLCIVLSISTFIAQGKIEVKLPSSASSAPSENEPVLRSLEVDANGNIFYEGQGTDLGSLGEMLSTLNPDEHLKLRIDEQSQFAVFIGIIDVLKAKGHENFSIATERK